METADGVELQKSAHSLKGSSGTLGAMRMAEICADLEKLGRNGLLAEQACGGVAELERELERVRRTFEGQLAEWALEKTALA